jgi:hypothetical protein
LCANQRTERELQAIQDLAIAFRGLWKDRPPGTEFRTADVILHGRAYLISQGYSPEETEQALCYLFRY